MVTVSVMKMRCRKLPLKIINCRDYKKFSNGKNVFSDKKPTEENGGIDFFLSKCSNVPNKHPPCKKKYIGGNQRPFMNKQISKGILKISKLRNTFLKTRNNIDKFNYNKQRNFCVSLKSKEKTKYFANLNIEDKADNKKFGKLLNPVFQIGLKTLKK